MNGDDPLWMVYLAGCLVLVGSALVARRMPIKRAALMAAAWIAILGAGTLLFAFGPEIGKAFGLLQARLRPEIGTVSNGSLIVPMGEDGHFWVRAKVNGVSVRFLIDSGATMTALSSAAVRDAGIAEEPGFGRAIDTANGVVVARRIHIGSLVLGPIERSDLAALTATEFGRTNVLGMNFLSTLSSWKAEDGKLTLRP